MWACAPSMTRRPSDLLRERAETASARCARGDREAKLRVLLAGHHELVGVRLHARRDAQGEPLGAGGSHKASEAGDLLRGVDDDAADTGGERRGELLLGLVVAVEDEVGRVHPRRQGDGELPSGGDIERHPLLGGEGGHRLAEEGLGRVGHPRAEGVHGLSATCPQVLLVVEEEGRSVLSCHRGERDPRNGQLPVLGDRRAAREEVRGDRCRRRRHMRSGAPMPSRLRPSASTRRVRSHSPRRWLRDRPSGARSTGQLS